MLLVAGMFGPGKEDLSLKGKMRSNSLLSFPCRPMSGGHLSESLNTANEPLIPTLTMSVSVGCPLPWLA